MNLHESLAAGRENVDKSDFTHGLIFAVLAVTTANFLVMAFLFGDQLTAEQMEVVSKITSAGFFMAAGLPLLAYLAGVIEAFEWRSDDEDERDAPPESNDKVRFEASEDGFEEVDADAREGSA